MCHKGALIGILPHLDQLASVSHYLLIDTRVPICFIPLKGDNPRILCHTFNKHNLPKPGLSYFYYLPDHLSNRFWNRYRGEINDPSVYRT